MTPASAYTVGKCKFIALMRLKLPFSEYVDQGLTRRLDLPKVLPTARGHAHKAAAVLPDLGSKRHEEDVETGPLNVDKPQQQQQLQQSGQGCQSDKTLASKIEIRKEGAIPRKKAKGQFPREAQKGHAASLQHAQQEQHVISPMVGLASPAAGLNAAASTRG